MSFDDKIVVNIFGEAQQVDRQSFGTVLWGTDILEAGFTERIRFYEKEGDVTGDSDLSAATKVVGTEFFAQTQHTPRLAIGRIDYAIPPAADEIDAIIAESNDWYGAAFSSRVQIDIIDIAAKFASLKKMYMAQDADPVILTGGGGTAFDAIFAANNPRTAMLYHSDDAKSPDLDWSAFKLAADPDEQTTTWSNATLVGPAVDTLTATEKANLRAINGNAYLTLGGVGATGDGKLADGNFIDTLITKDWFRFRTEEAIAQLLLDVSALNQKIPYTDSGISQIESVIRGVMQRGENIGHFRLGSSTINVPLVGDIDPADIAARELTLTATAILAGAVEKVTLNVAILTS